MNASVAISEVGLTLDIGAERTSKSKRHRKQQLLVSLDSEIRNSLISVDAQISKPDTSGERAKHTTIGAVLRTSFLPFFVLALPLLEIAGFVVVGKQIGALATVALVLASTIAGGMLLKRQGFSTMVNARAEIEAGRDPSRPLAHGAMTIFSALLLMVPGFITSIIGLVFLLPAVRDFAWRFLKSRVSVVSSFGESGFRSRQREKTIDLDTGDFSREPNPNSPWRRLKDE